MFGIDWQELLVIMFVAVVVIGPKDLPRAMRTAGRWIGKVRRTSNHFRAGIDAMIREAEMEEMEKKWAEQNARIMAGMPSVNLSDHEMRPLPKKAGNGAETGADLGAETGAEAQSTPQLEGRPGPQPDGAASIPDDEPQLPLR